MLRSLLKVKDRHGKPPLLYVLATGNLYGTERMALATVCAFREEFSPVIFAPPGGLVSEARRMDVEVEEVDTGDPLKLASSIAPYLTRYSRLVFIATRPAHAQVFSTLNMFYRRHAALLFVVHTRAGAYHRRLNWLPLTIIAISDFIKKQLVSNGVYSRKISVIEHFLPVQRIADAPRRGPFLAPGVRRVAVISRVEPEKRIDLLLACLENQPHLNSMEFHIYGVGRDLCVLDTRARRHGLNVTFHGFRSDVAEQLSLTDLLVHLCPDEPFGLALLEAMAAGVPVLTADQGGAGDVIKDGITGFHFRANELCSLGSKLKILTEAEPNWLNQIVSEAHRSLESRFSEHARVADYRSLIRQRLS